MARPRLGSDVGGFGQVPLWVIQRAPGSAVRVFGWLSGRYADRDKIAPSRKTLAAELGITDPKVIGDALAALEEIGALDRIERPGLTPELRLCYSKPENRGAYPSGKTEGGSTEKRKPPFRKTGTHIDQESFQESSQEVRAVDQKKRTHRRHTYCGVNLCVPDFLHEQFERQLGPMRNKIELAGMDGWYADLDKKLNAPIPDEIEYLRRKFKEAIREEFGDVA